MARTQTKIVIVGHVDHGKSTFVGRLFYDTGSLPEGKFESIQQMCIRRGMPFEWSFLMDALQAERDQGITIDTTQIWFKTARKDYVLIDAPGHKEFLKNMVTGAASSDAALLLIDAKEGVREQSKRHGYLLHLLGVKQIAVLVNKMDLIGYSEVEFRRIVAEYTAYLAEIGVTAAHFIPISAREGDCITGPSPHMPWYTGPSVTDALDGFSPMAASSELPLRFSVQDVYKFDERRILAGRIESGQLRVGDELLFSPSNTVAQIASIEAWNVPKAPISADAGESIGITLTEQIFVERGHIASHRENAPKLTNLFRARIFWLGRRPLEQGGRYKLKILTHEVMAEVKEVESVIHPDTLARDIATQVDRGFVAEVVFRVRGFVAVDEFVSLPRTGRFVIVDEYDVAGGGVISMDGFADQRVMPKKADTRHLVAPEQTITAMQRALSNGHTGGILWMSGLSGAGKSTLAREVERRLFQRGYQAYVLDGDELRQGLTRDLGFSPEARHENVRRTAEVAAMFARAGVIVIVSLITPQLADRHLARSIAPEHFHLAYIKADLSTCEKRDVKGLYKRARDGKIEEFTGISAPFDEPKNPDIIVDTVQFTVEESAQQLVDFIEKQCVAPVRNLELEGMAGHAQDMLAAGI